MHSAKTFCVPQKLLSPPLYFRPSPLLLVSVARELVAQAASLKAGVSVTLSDVSRHGDVQVEIRTNRTLNRRAWSFEPDFF